MGSKSDKLSFLYSEVNDVQAKFKSFSCGPRLDFRGHNQNWLRDTQCRNYDAVIFNGKYYHIGLIQGTVKKYKLSKQVKNKYVEGIPDANDRMIFTFKDGTSNWNNLMPDKLHYFIEYDSLNFELGEKTYTINKPIRFGLGGAANFMNFKNWWILSEACSRENTNVTGGKRYALRCRTNDPGFDLLFNQSYYTSIRVDVVPAL